MKQVLAILLLLITAFYVLPVSDGFTADTETCCKYTEKDTDDFKDTKKDKSKEFLTVAFVAAYSKHTFISSAIPALRSALPVHFTVETPPPDKA